jgi:uroporphyrinogen-III synthase
VTRPVLVIRPEPGNASTVSRARALGLDAIPLPLFAVRRLGWTRPDGAFDALLITSANAIHHGGAELCHLVHLPVWAVGAKSAAAARDAGFTVARTGSTGLADLLANAPPAKLLHLCGEDRIALPDWSGGTVMAVPVYHSVALEPLEPLASALSAAPLVMLHSPRAARHFADLAARCGADRAQLTLIAISPAVAEAAGADWERLAVAPQTGDEAMLELAFALCRPSNECDR